MPFINTHRKKQKWHKMIIIITLSVCTSGFTAFEYFLFLPPNEKNLLKNKCIHDIYMIYNRVINYIACIFIIYIKQHIHVV